jgi:hypothetical protein
MASKKRSLKRPLKRKPAFAVRQVDKALKIKAEYFEEKNKQKKNGKK